MKSPRFVLHWIAWYNGACLLRSGAIVFCPTHGFAAYGPRGLA